MLTDKTMGRVGGCMPPGEDHGVARFFDAPRLRAVLQVPVDGDELFELSRPFWGKAGHLGVIGSDDPEIAVFRLHLDGDLAQPVFVFAAFRRHDRW